MGHLVQCEGADEPQQDRPCDGARNGEEALVPGDDEPTRGCDDEECEESEQWPDLSRDRQGDLEQAQLVGPPPAGASYGTAPG